MERLYESKAIANDKAMQVSPSPRHQRCAALLLDLISSDLI